MATFIKIDRWAGILIVAAVTIAVWAFVFPDSFVATIDQIGSVLGSFG